MKKIIACLSILIIIACQEKPKDYATFSGKITNKNSDSLVLYKEKNVSKTIKVNEDGTFKDTLKVAPGVYTIFDGLKRVSIYLKNDYDLKMSLDAEKFNETLVFSGKGHENSTFLVKKENLKLSTMNSEIMKTFDSSGLENKMHSIKNEFNAFIDSGINIDSTIIADSKNDIDNHLKFYKELVLELYAYNMSFPKGMPSPTFENYENIKNTKTSLSDLKGKYVYIDVWATWCGPCIGEIPALKKLNKNYTGKNVTFVSLSVDDDENHKWSWNKAKKAWKKLVNNEELTGVQLIAPKGFKSKFVKDYKIYGIPRFILIDPDGTRCSSSIRSKTNRIV